VGLGRHWRDDAKLGWGAKLGWANGATMMMMMMMMMMKNSFVDSLMHLPQKISLFGGRYCNM